MKFSRLKPEITYYLLSAFSAMFNSIMFVTLIYFYYTVVKLNPLQLVLVGTVLESSVLILEIPTGMIADTFSRRLSVILGMLVLGLSFFFVSMARSFELVLFLQVVSGLGYTLLSGATDAWLADEVGEKQLGPIYLRAGQIERLAALLGIGLSALLSNVAVDLPLRTGGILYFLLGGFLILFMPESGFKPAVSTTGAAKGLTTMLTAFREGVSTMRSRPILMTLVVVNFFIGAASEGFDRLKDAHLVENFTFPALGEVQPVVWFSLLSLAASLFSLLTIEIFRRRLEHISQDPGSMPKVLLILNTISAASVVILGLAGNFPLAVACLLLRSAVNALLEPLYTTWLVQNSASRVRATLISMTGQTNALGQILGGPGVGWIGSAISLRSAIVTTGLLLTPISAVYSWAIRSKYLIGPAFIPKKPGAQTDSENA